MMETRKRSWQVVENNLRNGLSFPTVAHLYFSGRHPPNFEYLIYFTGNVQTD